MHLTWHLGMWNASWLKCLKCSSGFHLFLFLSSSWLWKPMNIPSVRRCLDRTFSEEPSLWVFFLIFKTIQLCFCNICVHVWLDWTLQLSLFKSQSRSSVAWSLSHAPVSWYPRAVLVSHMKGCTSDVHVLPQCVLTSAARLTPFL